MGSQMRVQRRGNGERGVLCVASRWESAPPGNPKKRGAVLAAAVALRTLPVCHQVVTLPMDGFTFHVACLGGHGASCVAACKGNVVPPSSSPCARQLVLAGQVMGAANIIMQSLC